MGQSLTKITFLERNELSLLLLPTQSNLDAIKEFLDSKKELFKKYNFTGGKGFHLFNEYSKNLQSNIFKEFDANIKGLKLLYLLEKNEELPPSLIINIGTGTSIVLKKESYKHLGGLAIGGGLFMGLVNLLFNITDFQEAISLAKKGNRYNVDLKVSDIYAPNDNRINLIFREFTAASLGKIDHNFDKNSVQKEDLINSVICLIGENISILACSMAENNNIKNLVFCGGFLKENRIVRRIISLICKYYKKKAIFLKNSEYCGALGALIG